MATPANLAQLADADLVVDGAFAPSDLLVLCAAKRGRC